MVTSYKPVSWLNCSLFELFNAQLLKFPLTKTDFPRRSSELDQMKSEPSYNPLQHY